MTVSPVPHGTMIKIDTTVVSLIFTCFYRGHLQAVLRSGAVVLEEQSQGRLWLILPGRLLGRVILCTGDELHTLLTSGMRSTPLSQMCLTLYLLIQFFGDAGGRLGHTLLCSGRFESGSAQVQEVLYYLWS